MAFNLPPIPAPPVVREHYIARSSTPIIQRISSARSTASQPLGVEQLGAQLQRDLANAIHESSNATKFIDNTFPLEYLPKELVMGPDIIETLHRQTISLVKPQKHHMGSEKDWANIFNAVSAAVAKATGATPTGVWSARHCNTPPAGRPLQHPRKPDIVLISQATNRQIANPAWHQIRAFCEVTKSAELHQRIQSTQLEKASIVFDEQHNRRFVPVIAISGAGFRFSIFDRAGLVQTNLVNVHNIEFFKVIVGMTFGNSESLGYDESMLMDLNGKLESVRLDSTSFDVQHVLFAPEALRGRATRCWQALQVDNGQVCVIKDSWPVVGRQGDEAKALHLISGIEGTPRLLLASTVRLHNQDVDSTAIHRREWPDYFETRIHSRIAITPLGYHIHKFTSKREIIGVFKDIVTTHRDMCRAGLLHRDISCNNVMIAEVDGQPRRRGLIVDFDYAAFLEAPTPASPNSYSETTASLRRGLITGTMPFISNHLYSHIAKQEPVLHTAAHDMESIFYVMLHIFMTFRGPGCEPAHIKNGEDGESSIWVDWCKDHAQGFYKDVWNSRSVAFTGRINKYIWTKFHRYFENLVPAMKKIYSVLFPGGPNDYWGPPTGTHDEIIEILETVYGSSLVDEPSTQDERIDLRHLLEGGLDYISSAQNRAPRNPFTQGPPGQVGTFTGGSPHHHVMMGPPPSPQGPQSTSNPTIISSSSRNKLESHSPSQVSPASHYQEMSSSSSSNISLGTFNKGYNLRRRRRDDSVEASGEELESEPSEPTAVAPRRSQRNSSSSRTSSRSRDGHTSRQATSSLARTVKRSRRK